MLAADKYEQESSAEKAARLSECPSCLGKVPSALSSGSARIAETDTLLYQSAHRVLPAYPDSASSPVYGRSSPNCYLNHPPS